MTILSDLEIYKRCVSPTHRCSVTGEYFWNDGFIEDLGPTIVSKGRQHWISALDKNDVEHMWTAPMIKPFVGESIKTTITEKGLQKILSYGLSSYGYDIRLAREDLKLFTNLHSTIVDPRNIDPKCYTAPEIRVDEDGLEYVLQPPNSLMLGHTVEWFNIPRDILATCLGKSTYARVGVSLIVTPLEPQWSGQLVVEIVNHTNSPVKIYPNQGIGQLTFNRSAVNCKVSYGDRGGKYQGQSGTTDAKV